MTTTLENKQTEYKNAKAQLADIISSIVTTGELTESQKTQIEGLTSTYNIKKSEVERDIEITKESYDNSKFDYLQNQISNLKTSIEENDDNIQFSVSGVVDGEEQLTLIRLGIDGIETRVGDLESIDNFEAMVPKYYLSTSRDELVGGSWLDTLPPKEQQQGKFVWIKYITTYSSGATKETDPICMTAQNGENGADGVDGQDGTSIIWQGSKSSHPTNPQNGWAYYNTTDKKSYIYQSSSWYQMTVDGADGQNGNDGKDGLSVEYKGILKDPPANPIKNWTYKDSDNGIVYIYTGLAWEVMTYDGDNGTDGANGTNGLSVFCTYHDSSTQPTTPTGNGTTGGWHTNWTSNVVWVSQKVSSSATTGTWGEPIKIQGNDGVSAEEIIIQYSKNKSTTTAPATGWDTSMPSYQEGYYLWWRTRTKWSNSSDYQYSIPVCDESWKVNQQVNSWYKQLNDKFTWLVKGGTSESTMILSDKLYQLMTEKIKLEAKDIELNGSININNGLFKVATNGNTKIGGLCDHQNTDGTDRGIIEFTSTGVAYFRNKTDSNTYTMLTDGKITVKNPEGTLTFENGQIKVSDGSVSTYYGDGYIGHNLSIMVDTPRLNCAQKVTATEFTSSTDVIVRSEQYNTTNPDGSTNNDGGKVFLACCGADASVTDSRVILFGKNSDGNYVFRPTSKAGVLFVGTTTYPIGTVTAKTFNNLSDRSLKENIRYISNSIYESNDPCITVDDCYNFMKNDLPITLYNYLENNKLQIGFVAQDVIYNSDKSDNKVGQMIVNMESYVEGNEDAKLSYDMNNIVGVTMATVQKIIKLVESQDLRIKTLEGIINGIK